MQQQEMKIASQFEKKYFFKRCHHDWRLPDPTTMFKDKKWAMPELMKFKDTLNGVKSKLNDFPLEKWHKHTTAMNPAGTIQRELRENVGPELLTQWNWMATTLNPHYESNDPENTIFDDRFIIPTEKHWTFGADQTGDILVESNMCHILNEANQRGLSGKGTLMLVTADGSVDCQFNPGEQESLVCTLHLCEATTALLLLDKGGSLLLKAFTIFEAENVCLLYLLAFAFESLVAWKPATSREGNSEMYLVCLNYRGQSELSPWLEVLRKYYGHKFNNAPMFSLDSIPETFLCEVVECAEKFMNYQINVIERNIHTFGAADEGSRSKGRTSTAYHSNRKIKYAVTREFFYRYRPKCIPNEAKLMSVGQQPIPMNAVKQLHNLYDSSGQYSFNQKIKHKRQELRSLEIWETLCRALNEANTVLKDYSPFCHHENELSLKYAGKSCKVIPPKSELTLQDVIVGLPLKKVLISKFCHNWLLHLHEQILSLWNHLEETTANRNQQEDTEAVNKTFPAKSENEEMVNQSSYASEGNPSHNEEQDYMRQNILRHLTDGASSRFIWCDKMSSGRFGSGLKELLTTLKGVEENGNLLILKALPMLTRVEVGIIYLLSQLFHQLWFMWSHTKANPEDRRKYYILLNGRHGCDENQMKIQHFLGELCELAANEEKKSSPQTLLVVVPIHLLCQQDFYQCLVCMNHLILQNSAEEILDDCLERIKMQQNLQ